MIGEKYILISVCDREIMTEQFESLEDAKEQLIKEIVEASRWELTPSDISGSDELEGYYGFDLVVEMNAYLNNGINGSDYDWRIVRLED